MGFDREELIDHYRKSREQLLAAIDGLSDEEMSERSLDGWSVNDHLMHIALWDEIRASEVRRISAGHESAWRMTASQDEELNELGYAMRQHVSAPQARYEIERTQQSLLEALADATPRGLEPSHYGEAGLRTNHQSEHAAWIQRWRDERGRAPAG